MKQTKIKHPASDIPENSLRAFFAGAAIFACASFIALLASGAHAQTQSLGAKYGTREPAKCFQCDPVYLGGGSLANAGKNCTSYDQPKAEGVCWKTTFGDWGCNMNDLNHSGSQHQKRNVAPPQ